MAKVFVFDLDMTLINSSALAVLRRAQLWNQVKSNLNLIRAFPASGLVVPHDVPKRLKQAGYKVGIVTASPKWYAEEVIKRFGIAHDVLVSFNDTKSHKPDPEPLLHALQLLNEKASKDVYYIGDDVADVEAAYHAGVTSIGVSWGIPVLSAMSSAAPDLLVGRASSLTRVNNLDKLAYAGECIASGGDFIEHWGSVLRCDDDPHIYALGRYFTTSDPRHANSALCAAVLSLKNDDSQAKLLGQAIGRTVGLLDDWKPRYIIPVPPKPSQQRVRFTEVLSTAKNHLATGITVEMKGLSCIKEVGGYKQMNADERKAAIRGAFKTNFNWNKNDILLVDDVYTTGETINECIRILKLSGAGEIRCLVIAKDQRVFVRKQCPACQRSMRIRKNRVGTKFWGCSGYPDYCTNTENL